MRFIVQFLVLVVFHMKFTFELIEDASERIIKYDPIEFPNDKLSVLAELTDLQHLKNTVDKILIPRIVGSPGHDKVRDFIVSSMKEFEWDVQIDSFMDKTPTHGKLQFENIIAMLNPNAERYLVLACHYDSKYIPNVEFLGATDSAVPCAMLVNAAFVLKDYLKKLHSNNELSLMFIFFDGEEAFQEWGPQDSIYGARHLAKKWHKTGFLKKIDMLVLLDLIGAPDPKFYSFFRNTEKWFARLVQIEENLALKGFLRHYTTSNAVRSLPNRYFQPRSANSYIEDDHTPFLKLGVPTLHLITTPFPEFWHTAGDNGDVIDYETVENLNRVLRTFIVEYLQITI